MRCSVSSIVSIPAIAGEAELPEAIVWVGGSASASRLWRVPVRGHVMPMRYNPDVIPLRRIACFAPSYLRAAFQSVVCVRFADIRDRRRTSTATSGCRESFRRASR